MRTKTLITSIVGLAIAVLALKSMAAIDSDYIRAERYLGQVETGLEELRPGDFDTYNSIFEKAKEVRALLEQTGSKEEPGYKDLMARFEAAAKELMDIQELWKNSSVMQQDHPLRTLSAEVAAFLENPASIDMSTHAKVAEFEKRLATFSRSRA